MEVDLAAARTAGLARQYGGKTWYFCSPACRKEFDANPDQYLGGAKAKPATVPEAQPARSKDPVCGMMVTEAKARAANRFSQYQGKTYFFCNDSCKQEFDADPGKYLTR